MVIHQLTKKRQRKEKRERNGNEKKINEKEEISTDRKSQIANPVKR